MKEHFQCSLNLLDDRKSKITIPSRTIPKDFSVDQDEFFCGGYFIGYDCSYTKEKIVDLFKNSQFSSMARKSADFLILFINKQSKEIFVLTGQTGKFPCYFAIENNILFLSTNFAWVAKQIQKKTININYVSQFIINGNASLITEETLFKEIKQIPPAILLTVSQDQNITLTICGGMPSIIKEKDKLQYSIFASKVLSLLEQLIEERLNTIKNTPYIIELSSGYDSSLVAAILAKKTKGTLHAQSIISNLSPKNNVKEITQKFAQKHKINVKFVNIDTIFPFSTATELQFTQEYFYPADNSFDFVPTRYNFARDEEFAVFNGNGGDELYMGGRHLSLLYPIQIEYFKTISNLKLGLKEIFTREILEYLTSQKRFTKLNLFANEIPSSTLTFNLQHFPVYWETNTWGMSPFTDIRMAQLSVFAPKNTSKYEIWKDRHDIFL